MRTAAVVLVAIISAALCGCAGSEQRRLNQLDADNPIVAPPAPPFGMEEFFAVSHQPDPRKARLGRWLFYDTRLSGDESVSCATCHRPDFAFSEPKAVAVGIGGQRGRRKTPSIINLAARTALPGMPDPGPTFFWDGRASSLEQQVLAPIADSREMAFDHVSMVERFSGIEGYRRYFNEAFGSPEITSERIASSLADFVRTRRSGNSPYDRWSFGGDAGALSREAQRGLDLFSFKASCGTCHAGFNFSDGLFHNLGVGWDEATKTFTDVGREAVTHTPSDRGRFKTPGLRDVDKHPPYMHDGSLATLRDVVEFYNKGGNRNPNQSGRIRPLGLTQDDVDAIVTFLKSLNGEGYQDRAPRFFPR